MVRDAVRKVLEISLEGVTNADKHLAAARRVTGNTPLDEAEARGILVGRLDSHHALLDFAEELNVDVEDLRLPKPWR